MKDLMKKHKPLIIVGAVIVAAGIGYLIHQHMKKAALATKSKSSSPAKGVATTTPAKTSMAPVAATTPAV